MSSLFSLPSPNTGRNDVNFEYIDDVAYGVEGDKKNSVGIKSWSILSQGGKHQRNNSGSLSLSGNSSGAGESGNTGDTGENFLKLVEEGGDTKTPLSALPFQNTAPLSPVEYSFPGLSAAVLQESQPSQSQSQLCARKLYRSSESSSESLSEN